jgi:hypothetical protein
VTFPVKKGKLVLKVHSEITVIIISRQLINVYVF